MGRYQIVARLGAGGMGRVYLGRSASGRAVAVKVVRAELVDDAGFRRRFAREIAAARRVTGFFTAAVVDADPEGSPAWLATAYVPGMSLEEAVRTHGAWSQSAVVALGAGLAEALEAIHEAGVIHRDLKPSNVLLAADGPRVIDFGISVAADASVLTQTGMVVGTPGFMSPEQVTGKQPVGRASDVFALGAVLAFTATGTGPFGTGSAHAVNFRAVYEQPCLDKVPPGLRDVVASCLVKDPGQRPSVARLLHQLVQATGAGHDVTAVLADVEWLPAPVATTVRTRSAERLFSTPSSVELALPSADTVSTEITNSSPAPSTRPEPRTETPGAPIESPSPNQVSGQPDGATSKAGASLGALPGGDLLPKRSAKGSRMPGMTRRRALRGLVGTTTAAGLGFVGWRIFESATLPKPGKRWTVDLSESVLASPAVAGGILYVCSTENTLYALDAATGNQRWKTPVSPINVLEDSGGDLTVAGGNAYLTFGSELHALDAATGEEKWNFVTAEDQWAMPAVAAGVVYVSGKNRCVYALDASTGKEKWSSRPLRVEEEQERALLAVAAGVVYAGGADGDLYALDVASGEEVWKFATGDEGRVYPTVAGGVVYIGSSYGNVWALDAATGGERWKLATNNGVDSPVLAARGVVYFGPYDLYALDAATGDEKWKWIADDEYVDSSPILAGSVVCFGTSEGSVYALDAITGKGRWKFPKNDEVNPEFTASKGIVYICDADGIVYAVDA
ncbi:PQQ-binding-like beta-propeller repeat protein [Streptomyces sp. NPDC018972]|uniref:serine/threonine-protein kinase n=1 Tax=Streptomyces sp. NPDC018972 TaxID=3365060 RepID=UPI0037B4AB7D